MSPNNSIPFTIGLTGGIGSGKSIVSQLFTDIGVPVIDTDQLSREIVSQGSPSLVKIADYFGPEILLGTGELDRQTLRKIVFSDKNKKQWLEQLLHPQIRKLLLNKLIEYSDDYVVIVIPLLFESKSNNNSYNFINKTLVVDCPEELQLKRALSRDQSSAVEIKKIIESQMPRTQRLSLADDVIVNDSSVESLREKVLKIHEKYQYLSP
ncbi:MAG: dephospho-CoA kinase [Gammaproteobacteria bacterium]|jgi:dephospho-CoA kinase|nr:dephospho-CoA kinase [Gammaproteobacteria bacterium]